MCLMPIPASSHILTTLGPCPRCGRWRLFLRRGENFSGGIGIRAHNRFWHGQSSNRQAVQLLPLRRSIQDRIAAVVSSCSSPSSARTSAILTSALPRLSGTGWRPRLFSGVESRPCDPAGRAFSGAMAAPHSGEMSVLRSYPGWLPSRSLAALGFLTDASAAVEKALEAYWMLTAGKGSRTRRVGVGAVPT